MRVAAPAPRQRDATCSELTSLDMDSGGVNC